MSREAYGIFVHHNITDPGTGTLIPPLPEAIVAFMDGYYSLLLYIPQHFLNGLPASWMIINVHRVVEHIHRQVVFCGHINGLMHNIEIRHSAPAVAHFVSRNRLLEEVQPFIPRSMVIIEIKGITRAEHKPQTVGGIHGRQPMMDKAVVRFAAVVFAVLHKTSLTPTPSNRPPSLLAGRPVKLIERLLLERSERPHAAVDMDNLPVSVIK